MDSTLFHFVNDIAGKSTILDNIMILFSRFGIFAFILSIIIFLFIKNKRSIASYGIFSIVFALLTSRALKYLIDRDRPFVVEDVNLLFEKSASPSFPSDQATICGVFIACFWMLSPKWRWLTLILGLLVAISRIFVGHHYPSDVLSGLIIGIVFSTIIYKINPLKKSTIE
ncbi:phosphatase PAP2 family protein [Lederbergia graminis]|uniref:Phosphatase PAP2 family protein n=1 Tax=Lederbergia graminis TaxID=735518 RepID=A0ABW0LGG7_9BACI